MSYQFTRWLSLTNTRGVREWMEPEANERFLNAYDPIIVADKATRDRIVPGWSAATFAGDVRKKDACEQVTAVVVDYDRAATRNGDPRLGALFDRYRIQAHTTWSSTGAALRFRAVLEPTRPMTPAEYAVVWTHVAREWEAAGFPIDKAAKDPSRFWFAPCVRSQEAADRDFFTWVGEDGPLLDVDAILAASKPARSRAKPAPVAARVGVDREQRYVESAVESAVRSVLQAPAGARNETLNREAYAVAGLPGVDLDATRAQLAGAAATAGLGADEIRKTLDGALAAGAERPRTIPERPAPVRARRPDNDVGAPANDDTAPAPAADDDWCDRIAHDRGKPVASLGNIVLVLRNAPEFKDALSYDTMAHQVELRGKPLRESELHAIRLQIEYDHGFAPGHENTKAAVLLVASERSHHPLQDYLRGLTWDGTPRLSGLAARVLGAPGELAATYLRKTMIAAVRRALHPGCKMDTVLVLIGPQGKKKSSVLRALASDPFFADDPIDPTNKDSVLQIHRAWIYELAEIDAITTRKHASDMKAFASRQVDCIRKPYGAAVEPLARSGITIGTTNEPHFLTDPSGSRRYWCLTTGGTLDVEYILANRDQLWAEAVAAEAAGEPHWLSAEEDAQRADEGEDFRIDDSWESTLRRWLDGPNAYAKNRFTSDELFAGGLQMEPSQIRPGDNVRLGRAMTALGWGRERPRAERGQPRERYYVRPRLPDPGPVQGGPGGPVARSSTKQPETRGGPGGPVSMQAGDPIPAHGATHDTTTPSVVCGYGVIQHHPGPPGPPGPPNEYEGLGGPVRSEQTGPDDDTGPVGADDTDRLPGRGDAWEADDCAPAGVS